MRWAVWVLLLSLGHGDLRAFLTKKHKGLAKSLDSSDRLQGHALMCLFSLSQIIEFP